MSERVIDIEIEESHPYFLSLWTNRVMYEEAYRMLQDEKSKAIMRGLIETRLYDNYEKALKPHYTHDEYFKTGLLEFTEQEVLVDAGAFDGDTIRCFKGTMEDKFKKIYSFEASPSNFSRLTDNLSIDDRVELNHVALGRDVGNVFFKENEDCPYANRVDAHGEISVKMNSLDNILGGKEVTMIKMDIEGAEIEALLGCKKLIQASKPKLALSVYHLFDDIWQIQMLVSSYVPNYKFYLRYHHSSGPYEVILYATL